MSATLGETALATLANRKRRPIEQAIAAPYPVIRDSRGNHTLPPATPDQASGRTIDVVVESHGKASERAQQAVAGGQSILWPGLLVTVLLLSFARKGILLVSDTNRRTKTPMPSTISGDSIRPA
jgi:hypothetical protein